MTGAVVGVGMWRTGLVVARLLTGHAVAVGSVPADPAPRDSVRTCTAAPNPVNQFPDVPNDALFCVDIAGMAEAGITGGREDGTYGPGDPVRPGHMAAFLYRFAGQPAVSPDAPSFSDVTSDHVFAREISWLAQEEISLGRGDGTFLPNDLLTRGQMSAFLYRFAGEPTVLEEGQQFPDVPSDHHFADAVAWMASTGVTTGPKGLRGN